MADERRLIDKRWDNIFEECDVLNKIEDKGSFMISSEDIRTKFNYEPRLLAKFDHHFQQPNCFKKHNISILPLDRRNYILSHFDNYLNFQQDDSPIEMVALPDYIETLHDTTSEANSLNAASAAGIFKSFFETNEICAALNGRMGSGQFDFHINNLRNGATMPVSVDKAQIEIDASFEGINDFFLIEAKMAEQDDFLIRQLYYPFRTIGNITNKTVRPIFFTCTNGLYQLREYSFTDPFNYNSLQLVNSKRYRIKEKDDEEVSLDLIDSAMRQKPYIVESKKLLFPQADSFERVINLCTTIKNNPNEFITLDFLGSQVNFTKSGSFTLRQVQYYVSAGEYLGLIEKSGYGKNAVFNLSQKALDIFASPPNKLISSLAQLILQHKPFHLTYKDYCTSGEMPTKSRIIEHMKSCNVNVKSESTIDRRAQTVSSWVDWIIETSTL